MVDLEKRHYLIFWNNNRVRSCYNKTMTLYLGWVCLRPLTGLYSYLVQFQIGHPILQNYRGKSHEKARQIVEKEKEIT